MKFVREIEKYENKKKKKKMGIITEKKIEKNLESLVFITYGYLFRRNSVACNI